MDIANRILGNQDRDGMLRRSLERIIQLYTDKSHFVYELLQNAEDSCATRIRFEQYEDVLVVMHNGAAFTETNLQGLCDIGQSDKINNLNQIGEFGVGFKSVFGICKTVRLYSNPGPEDMEKGCERFAVEIHDFTIPKNIEYKEVPEGYTTVFEFPYCVGETFSGFSTVFDLRKAIASRLKDLGITTLLFMRNLAIIDFEVHCAGLENKGQYRLAKRSISSWCTRVYAYENEDQKRDSKVSFLRFSEPIQADMPNRTLDIAFEMVEDDNGKISFRPAKNPYISVYFPTETESKLQFIVQGPFRTTPNRSSVPADDPTNVKFAGMLAMLLHKSILAVKKLGVLDLSFLQVLPLNEKAFSNYGLFLPLYEETRSTLRNEQVLPTKEVGTYVDVNHAIIPGNAALIDLFTGHDLAVLEGRKSDFEWLPASLTEKGPYSDVYAYVVNVLGVDVVRAPELRIYFNQNTRFLEKKDNDWLVRMYRLYETIPSAFVFSGTNMLDACIIRTESDRILPAYKKSERSYQPLVFLPSSGGMESHGVEVVHPYLYDRCRSFFEKTLHLKLPDDSELIKETIASHYKVVSSIDSRQHLIDLGKALKHLKHPDHEDDMRSFLKKNFYIRVKARGKTLWTRPFEETLYFPVSAEGFLLEEYFKGLPGEKSNVYLDYDFYQEAGYSMEDMKLFDVTDSLLTGMDETSGEYRNPKTGQVSEWKTYGAFRWKLGIEQAEDALLFISRNPADSNSIVKSQIIFRLLLDNELRLFGNVSMQDASDLHDVPADIVRMLKREQRNSLLANWNGKWLFSKSMELVAQSEISKRDLNDSIYGKMRIDSNVYDWLGFKKNRLDQLAAATVEYDRIPKETKQMYLEIELNRSFGLTVEQLKMLKESAFKTDSGSGRKDEPADYEFPVENVKNYEALKKHAAQILLYANPVSYARVVRSVRISRADDDVAAYLKNMYRVNASRQYACQICHKAFSSVEMCQLESKPNKELDPLNLCLCPTCASRFRVIRNNDTLCREMMESIYALSEMSIRQEDHVSVHIADLDIWFTQTHIAEIVELLHLKDKADKAIEETKEREEQRASVYAPKLKLPGQDPEPQWQRPAQASDTRTTAAPKQRETVSSYHPPVKPSVKNDELSPWEHSTRQYTAQTWKPTIKPVPADAAARRAAEEKRKQEQLQKEKQASENREKENRIRERFMGYVGKTVYHTGFMAHIFVKRFTGNELEVEFIDGPRKGEDTTCRIAFCLDKIRSDNDILAELKNRGISCIDRREVGGSLWVVGGHELDRDMEELKEKGYSFYFKPEGGKASKGQPAWFMTK